MNHQSVNIEIKKHGNSLCNKLNNFKKSASLEQNVVFPTHDDRRTVESVDFKETLNVNHLHKRIEQLTIDLTNSRYEIVDDDATFDSFLSDGLLTTSGTNSDKVNDEKFVNKINQKTSDFKTSKGHGFNEINVKSSKNIPRELSCANMNSDDTYATIHLCDPLSPNRRSSESSLELATTNFSSPSGGISERKQSGSPINLSLAYRRSVSPNKVFNFKSTTSNTSNPPPSIYQSTCSGQSSPARSISPGFGLHHRHNSSPIPSSPLTHLHPQSPSPTHSYPFSFSRRRSPSPACTSLGDSVTRRQSSPCRLESPPTSPSPSQRKSRTRTKQLPRRWTQTFNRDIFTRGLSPKRNETKRSSSFTETDTGQKSNSGLHEKTLTKGSISRRSQSPLNFFPSSDFGSCISPDTTLLSGLTKKLHTWAYRGNLNKPPKRIRNSLSETFPDNSPQSPSLPTDGDVKVTTNARKEKSFDVSRDREAVQNCFLQRYDCSLSSNSWYYGEMDILISYEDEKDIQNDGDKKNCETNNNVLNSNRELTTGTLLVLQDSFQNLHYSFTYWLGNQIHVGTLPCEDGKYCIDFTSSEQLKFNSAKFLIAHLIEQNHLFRVPFSWLIDNLPTTMNAVRLI